MFFFPPPCVYIYIYIYLYIYIFTYADALCIDEIVWWILICALGLGVKHHSTIPTSKAFSEDRWAWPKPCPLGAARTTMPRYAASCTASCVATPSRSRVPASCCNWAQMLRSHRWKRPRKTWSKSWQRLNSRPGMDLGWFGWEASLVNFSAKFEDRQMKRH